MASDWRDIGGFPCRRSEWWSSPKEAATGGSVHATIASPVIASKGGRVATLLTDLLTPDEAEDRRKIFDIDLLADRVLMAKAWLEQGDRTEGLGIGYFGASTEVGAALRRLPAIPRRSKPSCRVEEDRIWPKPICRRSQRQRCRLSVETTSR